MSKNQIDKPNNGTEGQEIQRLPMVPLRGMNVFPATVNTLDIGRTRSMFALKRAMDQDERLFVVAQIDVLSERPLKEELYVMGTIVNVRQFMPLADNGARILVEGAQRALLLSVLDEGDFQTAEVLPVKTVDTPATPERRAMMRTIVELAEQILEHRNASMPELIGALEGEENPALFCDVASAGIVRSLEHRQGLLALTGVDERLQLLLKTMAEELDQSILDEKIHKRVHEYMDQANHEYYLREQIHAIQNELGDEDDEEIVELRRRLENSKMSQEAHERTEKELKRLARTSVQAPESTVSLNYIEYMLDLPWGVYDDSKIDIRKARRIFDEDHYGMREVKDRLIEYLAVRSVAEKLHSPILCLVGPPGVGKTSIARSIARALNRKFVQMSLGGVHDEAEIRGHRRTYVGAMPGRIISSINQCKTMNPVFLLDEIDKLARDMRGDPASAMLEVLDPEQNSAYRDHYLEAPFNLGDVLFITTANSTETIDRALLDRMEIIEVPSYTLEEKVQIARRHLLPKQMKQHALAKGRLRMSDKTISALIDGYTRESGVRNLERLLAAICRKVTLKYVEEPEHAPISIRSADLKEYLGPVRFLRQDSEKSPSVGIVNGLAWTSVGGEVMPVEVAAFPGKGALEITGSLGDVMKESARIARSAVRARLDQYAVAPDFFEKHDIHIHVPEGAVPKDGPSAGVALASAIMSAASSVPADNNWAMTGEITLHGKVLPIGGVREKLLAAYRMGICNIMLPVENKKDLDKIDEEIRTQFNVVYLKSVDEAFRRLMPAQRGAGGGA